MSESEAYEEGYRCGAGTTHWIYRDDNPYDDGIEWLEWDRGFTDGEIDAREAAAEYRAEARREERWLEKLNKQE
jgi:hypothetical protein